MRAMDKVRLERSLGAILATMLLTCFPAVSKQSVADMHVGSAADPAAAVDMIWGMVVDHATNLPVTGANVVLEQPDANGVDRVVATTTTFPGGFFLFTGLQAGNYYDVVADTSVASSSGITQTYAAMVTFRVPVGSVLFRVPLVPEFGDSSLSGQPALISAAVTTSSASGAPAEADVGLSALQRAPLENGAMVQVTIPPFSGSTPLVTTSPNADCTSGTACANYALYVPSSDPVYVTYHLAPPNYTIPSAEPAEVIYFIEGKAFVPGTNTPDCNSTVQISGQVVPRGTLVSSIPNLSFAGCQ